MMGGRRITMGIHVRINRFDVRFPMVMLILFLFISTKYKDFAPSLIFSLVFGFIAIMTHHFNASIYGYPRLLEWVPTTATNYQEFVESIFIFKPEDYLIDYSFYGTIMYVLIMTVLGVAMYKAMAEKKYSPSLGSMWLSDGLNMALCIPILALYFMVLVVCMDLAYLEYLTVVIAAPIMGYIISRLFMAETVEVNKVDEQTHEIRAARYAGEEKEKLLKEINVKRDDEE